MKNGHTVLGTNPALVLTHALLDVRSLSLLTLWTLILLGQREPVFLLSLTWLVSNSSAWPALEKSDVLSDSRGETLGLGD